jgi:predicted  nucleic acid-binding Zn-ribbon protein
MFYCTRCGIRFSSGALSGETECPRCKVRDGVAQPLRAEHLRPIERLDPSRPNVMRPQEGSASRPTR